MSNAAWLAAGVLAGAAAVTALAAQGPTAPAPFVTVARSAQITLDASDTAEGMTLRLRASVPGTAPRITEVAVSLAGVHEAARLQPDGSWFVPLPPAGATHAGKLEVYVAHDGIREVLSGTLTAAPAAAAGRGSGLLGEHKQLAWWVLNITIVLIGVLALSRRMS